MSYGRGAYGGGGGVPSGGTDGQVLTADGGGGYAWGDASGGGAGLTAFSAVVGEVAGGAAGDFAVALPEGVSAALIVSIKVARTGDASTVAVTAYSDDARLGDAQGIIGDEFSGVSLSGATPVYGPQYPMSAPRAAAPVVNTDGTSSLPLTLHNFDFSNAGTFTVTGALLPIPSEAI